MLDQELQVTITVPKNVQMLPHEGKYLRLCIANGVY